jgi:predicted nucleic acid-binding protein
LKFLDANVLIHAAVMQEPREHALAVSLLQRLRHAEEEAFITDLVIAEVAANLRTARAGRMNHLQIREFLDPVLNASSVHLADKGIWPRALDIFVDYGIDLPDAHQAALVQRDGDGAIISFDTGFDRIPGVARVEP